MCYVLWKGHKINKTNTYLERRIKVLYDSKQVIQYRQCSYLLSAVFVTRLPNVCGTKPFKGGFGRRAVAQYSPKYLGPCRHSLQKRCLRRQLINLAPLRKVRAWGYGLLRLEESLSWLRDANAWTSWDLCQAAWADYHIQRRDTPDQIRAADTTVSRSLPHLLDWYYWAKQQQVFAMNSLNGFQSNIRSLLEDGLVWFLCLMAYQPLLVI